MSGHDRNDRIQDLLDGLLSPAAEAEVRRKIAGDAEWTRDFHELQAVHALLDEYLDVSPPADLAPSVLKAVLTDRVRRSHGFHLPARLENGLVLGGVAALAAAVLGVPRLLGAETWLGRALAFGAQMITGASEGIVLAATSTARLDWLARLLTTLTEAVRTVVESSAEPLLALSLAGVALAAAVAWFLVRTEKGPREGGVRHAHLAI